MNKQILLVEDDDSLRENIGTLLKEDGYNVFTASTAEEGVNLAKEKKLDLIISDIMLPGIDGHQFLDELLENNLAIDIPFIFLTAKTDIRDLRLGMERGADDYIFKPFRAEDLLHSVETRLKRFDDIKKSIGIKGSNVGNDKKYSYEDRIYIEGGVNPKFIKVADIRCITAENQYSLLHINSNASQLVRKSLNSWEKVLPDNYFIRIHRSSIINIDAIVKIERWINNNVRIYIEGIEAPLQVSKRFVGRLKSVNRN